MGERETDRRGERERGREKASSKEKIKWVERKREREREREGGTRLAARRRLRELETRGRFLCRARV